MIKKILLFILMPIVLISCWDTYESDYVSAYYFPAYETNNCSLFVAKRKNLNNLNDIIIAVYDFKSIDKIKETLKVSSIQYIKNVSNVYSDNYYIELPITDKYKNVDIKFNDKKQLLIKDWDNQTHTLKYTTNNNIWINEIASHIMENGYIEKYMNTNK